MSANYRRLIPLKLNAVDWLDYSESIKIAEAVKQFYFGKEEIGFKTAENLKNVSFNFAFKLKLQILFSTSQHRIS